MARRPTPSPRRAGARSAARDAAAETWLLLLGCVAAVLLVATFLYPTPPAERDTGRAKRLTMAQARASNRAVPIEARLRVPAPRYRFAGGPAEREQATECLATAALYEAGDDREGQKAVIQVILNRVRAPGFPRTICGVVYQGYSRAIGCQFSFTCDGSFDRRPVHTGWSAARRAARRALAGRVFADVGGATHYHADWMVPYWRDSLVKIAQVGSHIFYRRQTGHDGFRRASYDARRNIRTPVDS
ncbi:cell wall hydrolase [Sphingomonas glacialis]|uniref:Cell wall hydrolase n=1 Tax=Sphingomonas glacialis TaxID=658225 RepID=A0A502FXW0_9SPHN|nr:cell wall hydrolase [Sphingomonas glacialis]TPG54348.1 cell wall hydrolase [Sphingomonas glacialis]